ncbi:hypothetical protein G7047_00595 [Diaphorobacter sp. HDW4A]|uniref:hypothetical protein n=1 Tax=Diaphorobacter sp. HDW4A TaxID=2714924 RepID=UPI00140C7EE2|nr:hypothetical protein [Diaphorobacter sp. HDW4A]QIL78583.1 hypothetical protein G7047_00595 [Diaphorobacter sp. HDW4A]
MTAAAILETLRDAGLQLNLTSEHTIKVKPATLLNDELRTLIRSHKDELAKLLEAEIDAHERGLDVWKEQTRWRERSTSYYMHHIGCADCIAAGRGAGYGERCAAGAGLWKAYQDASKRKPLN